MKKYIFLFLWGISVCHSKAQGQDTSQWPTRIQISLLTCDASWDIYTLWGHTAIRVVDSTQGTDIVFNYGTFNFNEPNFIAQFVKGDLLYFVSVNNYSDFLNEYQIEYISKLPENEKNEIIHELIKSFHFSIETMDELKSRPSSRNSIKY